MFAGANVNLDPTRREGVELRLSQTLSSAWSVQTTAQHVSPTFRSGANTGKDIPLVAHNTLAARLTWTPGDGRRGDIGWQWADTQRYGNDFANTCSTRVPSFDSLDGRYAWRYDGWEFALVGNNLTDKRYFSTAYGACRNGIYPDPGRQLQITARRDF
jgi:iron complex outermembrane receptor protein